MIDNLSYWIIIMFVNMMFCRQELERKIASIQKLAQEIQEVTSLLQSSIDGCQYKNHLGLDVEKSKTWADSVAKEVEILANMAGKNGDDDEILHKLKQFKDSTQNFGDLIKKAIGNKTYWQENFLFLIFTFF